MLTPPIPRPRALHRYAYPTSVLEFVSIHLAQARRACRQPLKLETERLIMVRSSSSPFMAVTAAGVVTPAVD